VQYLADDHYPKAIACTQPRKIAAKSLAERVAEEYGCKVGEDVGYTIGEENKSSSNTKIKFMTDRMLLNELLDDRKLSKYSCVVVDEAHERCIDTDLILGLVKEAVKLRPDLRVVVTSASLDKQLFSAYFNNCPVIEVPGRTFPVEIKW
jgi:ATP-dependent RNA helicase DHX8/PRP22